MVYTLKSKISEEDGTVILHDVDVDVLDVDVDDDDNIYLSLEDLN